MGTAEAPVATQVWAGGGLGTEVRGQTKALFL
jgi:hypothetical protein